jgi:hypothetical protein
LATLQLFPYQVACVETFCPCYVRRLWSFLQGSGLGQDTSYQLIIRPISGKYFIGHDNTCADVNKLRGWFLRDIENFF